MALHWKSCLYAEVYSHIHYDWMLNDLSLKELKKLSKHKDWQIRCLIAEHLKTPPHILKRMVEDKDWRVRVYVADNCNTPKSALFVLAMDKNTRVVDTVASSIAFEARYGK